MAHNIHWRKKDVFEVNSHTYEQLKNRANQKELWIDTQNNSNRGCNSDNTNKKERISRALSWYERSEKAQKTTEYDEELIYAWIAFNALYSKHTDSECLNHEEGQKKDREKRRDFYCKLSNYCKLSKCEPPCLYHDIFKFANENIEELQEIIGFKYLSKELWKGKRGISEKLDKKEKDAEEKTPQQLENKDFFPLELAIENIYQLRNQLMHGMAAYKDIYNRTQVKLCANFLHSLTGYMIRMVIMDKYQDWGIVGCPPQGTPDDIGGDDLETLSD